MGGARGDSDQLLAAIEAAQRWAIYDPDPITRSALDRLIDAADPSLLALFDGRLSFGTAGLRAAVGPGPKRMNALVVRQTTAAVVTWLQANGVPEPVVVVGFDARADSQDFARHVAAAVAAGGATFELADAALSTPVIAHRLLQRRADAAIVITASHNPAADNGYKLYLGDGLQLVAPADAEIAAHIEQIAASWSSQAMSIDDEFPAVAATHTADSWEADHRAAAVAAMFSPHRDVSLAYTPLHGVGGMTVVRAFRAAGFADPLIVEEQFEPDAAFPTVAFPNPEEPGALDLALALAADEGVDAVFANDPDADRLAIAVPSRSGDADDGGDAGDAGDGFVMLTGNQVGALLADHVLRYTTGQRVVARSIVSSRLLDALANAHEGVVSVVTLTGFKWVARPMLTHAPHSYVFGFEEALGYCVGSHVRDKDGVTAALIAAELIAELKADGRTVWDRLDELALAHGVHMTAPVTIRFDDDPHQADIAARSLADEPPESFGGVSVTRCGPLGFGTLPATSGLQLELADHTQIIVRPSGTEPKLKAYVEVVEPVTASLDVAQTVAAERLDRHVAAVRELLS